MLPKHIISFSQVLNCEKRHIFMLLSRFLEKDKIQTVLALRHGPFRMAVPQRIHWSIFRRCRPTSVKWVHSKPNHNRSLPFFDVWALTKQWDWKRKTILSCHGLFAFVLPRQSQNKLPRQILKFICDERGQHMVWAHWAVNILLNEFPRFLNIVLHYFHPLLPQQSFQTGNIIFQAMMSYLAGFQDFQGVAELPRLWLH